MRRIGLILVAATLFAIGCAVEPVELQRAPGEAERSHVCGGSCDHIFVDGGWQVVPRHRHGPECGHVLVDGKWVKADGMDPAQPKDR